ncbi:probable inactive serine/threonine-protein kinase fnkC [Rosa chinensis]|uniref:probable inactive serine/threonine-protein kinase fnkC n=1 Tax=Rosa chinensis TaxID=74649 RepID=UPI000D09768E|nr:probable inactive serine/threonine-protein kinase fnkC [Rosa chinensis]
MASLNFNDQDGVLRSIRDAPPTHYTLKIESLSMLTKNSLEKYESGEFEAGGYKWKLVFYPNGNKSKNVKDHISLYLVMAGANTSQIHCGVHAVFRLFLLDQNTSNYLVFQEQKERRFHAMKLDWGFDQFLSLKDFFEASNGFLMDDTCVFGAEVFVSKERSTGKGECLSMVKDAVMYKHVWKIDSFSKINTDCHDSKTFSSGDQKWKIQLYPKGKGIGTGSHLSLYLALADPTSLPRDTKIYTEFTLRILEQTHQRHQHGKASFWFSASDPERGWQKFITLGFVSQTTMGFLLKDTCIVEAEVTVHGISNAL